MDNEIITIKTLLAIMASDIDISLLQNKEQTADNEKEYFTREEIRIQLKKTVEKLSKVIHDVGYNIDAPLHF